VTPRSTCCNTPDLEAASLTVEPDRLVIDLKKAPSLGEVGNAVYVTNEAKSLKLILVRAGRGEYFALSRMCTHGGQTISFNRKRGVLQCNNFNHSIFDLGGGIVKGPAETPLKSYPVTLAKDRLVIAI
jgi:Rieske Fe-S protein